MLTSEKRIKNLIQILNDASRIYYTSGKEPMMTDKQYDALYSELVGLEKTTGIIFSNSPTIKVGFEESTDSIKIEHYKPILSLNSTKSIDELCSFLGEQEGILSWKLDGIAIILYYSNGYLKRAVSRGNGKFGRDITRNVRFMQNIPQQIEVKNDIVIRGEGCISVRDFNFINDVLDEQKFSNPRNLIAGLVNASKTSSELLKYGVFIAHSMNFIFFEDASFATRYEELLYLKNLGFKVVFYTKVSYSKLRMTVEDYSVNRLGYPYPVDGLVLNINDILYGNSLGQTERYPKHSMAFKWPDDSVSTKVTGMKWSVSKTGLITPVIIFTPLCLEGTEVKQANLHSLKIFEMLEIGIGDTIKVYKANMIVPAVEDNLTRSGTEKYPLKCPECGADTYIVETDKTRKLFCKRNMPWKCKEE